MIYTTAYVSTLAEGVTDDDVEQLLEHSRVNNARDGVTGLLVLRDRRVMQLLEGGEAEVRGLFERIAHDPRHDSVVTVWRSTTEERRFPQWSMGYDDLATSPADDLGAAWDDPTIPVPAPGADPETNSRGDYLQRRAAILRRALASGDRLATSLAIILNGHRPEEVLEDDGEVRMRCAECRVFSSTDLDRYPCSTARNAIWALEGVLL